MFPVWLGVLGAAVGACHTTPGPDLPDPDIDLGLGNVVLLTFTTRAPEGLLGHACFADSELGGGLDPHRKPIAGSPREVPTAQHLRLLMRVEDEVGLGGGYGPASASVKASRATHVAYDVQLTSYLEYTPAELKYDPNSACCVNGARGEACGTHYVTRLFRGTGSTQLLTELSGSASVHAADILHASGGRSFRKLSESTFEDAFFGYELESLDALCSRLDPEQEMPPLDIEAPKNCYFTYYTDRGERSQASWTLPDQELCVAVLEKACSEVENAIRCEGRFKKPAPLAATSAGAPPSDADLMITIPLLPKQKASVASEPKPEPKPEPSAGSTPAVTPATAPR